MANLVFGHHDSENVCKKGELFIVWCAFDDKRVDMGAFISGT